MDKKEILDILDNAKDERGAVPMRLVRQAFDKLVQPEERTKKRTETHACDLIGRQVAIDALDVLCQEHRYKIPGKIETYSQYNEAWQDALDRAEGAIFNLPTAQPEQKWIPCDETVDIPDHEVMACDRYGEFIIGYLDCKDEQWLCESDDSLMYDPVAWCELPKPYKEGGADG
ncbi:hypothetical protein ACR77U_13340 [Enterococcus faecium]|uniref:hypothetical protein n=1 Tax=Enterococcus faecium TaxID=1352 RepID=UPI003DA56AD7